MNRIVKGSILLIMLAIPACIILFLHSFGKNEYTLPVFHEKGLDGCPVTTTPHTIHGFSFISSTGQKMGSEDLEERITVVNFFPPACTDECQTIFDELANLQQNFSADETVRILSISTRAVGKDTLDVFAQKYKSNPAKWLFLVGEQEKALDLARCGFGLDNSDGEHSLNTTVLVDGEKRIRGYYNMRDPKETERLEVEIRILLRGIKT